MEVAAGTVVHVLNDRHVTIQLTWGRSQYSGPVHAWYTARATGWTARVAALTAAPYTSEVEHDL